MLLTPGLRLAQYQIVAPLGSGGMGEVYRARDTRLDRDVAIKVMADHVASDPAMRHRFETEAKSIASLSHPNILAIYELAFFDGFPVAVMELLEGETLRSRLRKGRSAGARRRGSAARSPMDWRQRTARGSSTAISNQRTSFSPLTRG